MPEAFLVPLGPGAYYLPGSVNVGVLQTPDGGALLVDSGADKEHARRLLRACRAAGLEPRAIMNTHSHADHYGGNAHLQATLGIPAYAPPLEEAVMRYPLLEPVYLYSGARPPKALQSRWLMGPPSEARVLGEPGRVKIAGLTLTLLDTGGHAHRHFSVLAGDVLLASDAVFGPALLEKYPLQFGVDIARQRESVALVGIQEARVVLPGHGEPTADLASLAAANLAALERASAAVRAACDPPATLPEVLWRVCEALGVEMTDLARYHLNQTTVLAHLTELLEGDRVGAEVRENRLLWMAA